MTLCNILHANDVIWLICKLGSREKIFMQITKTSTIIGSNLTYQKTSLWTYLHVNCREMLLIWLVKYYD